MRCPECRCLLASGHRCYNCGYDSWYNQEKPVMEVTSMIPDDEYEEYPDDEYGECPDDECDEYSDDDE